MNRQEFLEFLQQAGSTIQSLPVYPFKNEWAKITGEISPHFYGDIPEALGKTFPNEDEEVFNYRKETYQAKTKACITDAINKLSRLLQDSKYSVKYGNQKMQELIEKQKRVGGDVLTNWFLSKFVSKRMLDPNACLVVWPEGEGITNPRVPVDFSLKFVDSKDIKFIDFDLKLLIYNAPTRTKYQSVLNIGAVQEYRQNIITDQFYGYIGYNEENVYGFHVVYEHNMEYLPFVVLGGRPLTREYRGYDFTYYESDLSSAIPYLNDAATSDNQHKSVVNANCFPHKVMNGIECPKCHGVGTYSDPIPEEPDRVSTCGECHGSGLTIYNSPLKGIVIRDTGIDTTAKPIEFISPNVDTIKLVGEYAEKKMQEAKEIMNIDKAVRLAQSGIAKEIDKQPEYIEVKRIADNVFYKMNVILIAVQRLVFMNDKAEIIVIPPVSFDIKTEGELYEEFQKTMTSKAPDFVRATAFTSWVKQRFSSDKSGQRIADICLMYAPLYLYTIEERNEELASRTVTRTDLIKAQFVFNALMQIYEQDNMAIYESYETIESQIDAILQPRFDAANASTEIPEPEFPL